MSVSDFLAVLHIVDPRRKPLERLGAFLCRGKIAALERETAVAKADAEECRGKSEELQRELVAQKERLAVYERREGLRRRFRRVPVGPFFVYVERLADADDPPPLTVCPSCFERDEVSLVFPSATRDTVGYNLVKKRVHFRCRREGCGFHIAVTPEAFRKAFESADELDPRHSAPPSASASTTGRPSSVM